MNTTTYEIGQRALISHRCSGSSTNRATWNGAGWHCTCGDVVFDVAVTALGKAGHTSPARCTDADWVGDDATWNAQ